MVYLPQYFDTFHKTSLKEGVIMRYNLKIFCNLKTYPLMGYWVIEFQESSMQAKALVGGAIQVVANNWGIQS